MRVNFKLLTQFFDPNKYKSLGRTSYGIQARYKTGLITSISEGIQLYANKHINNYDENWTGVDL